jgi:HTH-type transcriptional regulator/antitoxin HigA
MYLDALTDLVMVWEDENIHFRRVPGVEILQDLMREHGLTQSELSRKTGIAQSTLSAIVTGGRSITVKHAEVLGKYFATGARAFLPR